MGDLRPYTSLHEFTISRDPALIADEILAQCPPAGEGIGILGFGVYIWNVRQTEAVLTRIRASRPDIRIVLGGPEVSYEVNLQSITAIADFVITGWGDISFPKLCRALIDGPRPLQKVIAGEQPPLEQIALPYREFSDADLAHRVLYVEASRGCPFKCEFCLSALDKTAWAFDLDTFLDEMAGLYTRGARLFKFVDRTFNLKIDASLRILQFFLERIEANAAAGRALDLFVHFEVVPDHLPDRLKEMIARFPPGALQFEIGIQSFDVEVQKRISRRQDNDKTAANLQWLRSHSHAHIHADLIFGLPGETLDSFADGFDRLYALQPHEIQPGILKRLRGTPIIRHTETWGMVFDPEPPYQVKSTSTLDAAIFEQFEHFARYWDLIANSGRFGKTIALILDTESSPFRAFWRCSAWLWTSLARTQGVSPEMLVDQLFTYLTGQAGLAASTVRDCLLADYVASGARSNPVCLQGYLPKLPVIDKKQARTARQDRHEGAA
ncbi:DUF4080 domain-containing protein [Burkholderiaceae bacterium DAT-1]|nr:DUF4080 domain-containing protein [Burkholderiaceae bacterium DAT-1]